MRLHITGLCTLLLLAVSAPDSGAAETLYGGGDNQGATVGALLTIDVGTGLGAVVGSVLPGAPGMTGLAFDTNGTLYATVKQPGADALVEQVNITTGAAVPGTAFALKAGNIAIEIADLALNPLTRVLYGISNNSFLYTINPATGVAALVGTGNSGTGRAGGLAFSPNGTL